MKNQFKEEKKHKLNMLIQQLGLNIERMLLYMLITVDYKSTF